MSQKCLILVVALLSSLTLGEEIKYKICATSANNDACQQIARDKELACNITPNKVNCILNINSNKSHIGVLSPEEAFLSANLISDNVVVLGEIISKHPPPQTVVIIKSSIPSSIGDLKGRKVCYPGFKHDDEFSHLQLQDLDLEVVRQTQEFCPTNSNITLLEHQISWLASFFGDSCRPGPWTQNSDFDAELKEKYSSLCNLCGPDKCNVNYRAPFEDSIKCLVEHDADVAFTTLTQAQIFLHNLTSSGQTKYKFLCKNGTSASASAPCSWSTQLPTLLVSNRNSVIEMTTYVQSKLKSRIYSPVAGLSVVSPDVQDQLLSQILNLNRHNKIKLASTYKDLNKYVNEIRPVPTLDTSKKCNLSLKWCTYSDKEQEKCKWLSQAALNRAIQPVVECVKSDSEISCLNQIQKENADIVVASADLGYIAMKKKLQNIAFPQTDTRKVFSILAVKRNDDTSINNFQNLKNQKGCFPQFGGQEHVAFVNKARDLGLVKEESCNYGKILSELVGNSCVPGARSPSVTDSADDIDADKLCNLCVPVNQTITATYCSNDGRNKYYESEGALTCLKDKAGDFAIITKPINGSTDDWNNFTVICKNNSLALYNGLNVDENCALNVISTSEIVLTENNPKKNDIVLALYEFERWFGQDLKKIFHLFDEFDGTQDLLFKDSTSGLMFKNYGNYINNYRDMLEKTQKCSKSENNDGAAVSASVIVILGSLIFICTSMI